MNMRYISVASGSSGNCHYIEKGNTKVLIDAGISGKKIENGLKEHMIDLAGLNGILVTHEHTDHIKSIGVISRRYDVPIYGTEKTWDSMENSIGKIKEHNKRVFLSSEDIFIGDICVKSFPTSHDAVDPSGFTFRDSKGKISIATDLGYITDEARAALIGSDIVVLESNHDIEMLKMGSYPYYLKKRVLSEYGHLSNVDAGNLAKDLIKTGTKSILLAHLSRENNMPMIARQTVSSILESEGICSKKDLNLTVLSREFVSDIYTL